MDAQCPVCLSPTDTGGSCRNAACSHSVRAREDAAIAAVTIKNGDMVHHPAHYGGNTTYEHVKVATAWGLDDNAFLYNCTKYICRVGKKDHALEDLQKALWYLERAIEKEKRDQDHGEGI